MNKKLTICKNILNKSIVTIDVHPFTNKSGNEGHSKINDKNTKNYYKKAE